MEPQTRQGTQQKGRSGLQGVPHLEIREEDVVSESGRGEEGERGPEQPEQYPDH